MRFAKCGREFSDILRNVNRFAKDHLRYSGNEFVSSFVSQMLNFVLATIPLNHWSDLMSLEAALIENTAVMRQLITVLSTAAEAGAVSAPPPSGKAPRGKKTETANAAADASGGAASAPASSTTVTSTTAGASELINHGGETVHGVVEGDPVGTIYFVIEKHRTAAAVRPGEVIPNIDGAQQVAPAQYLEAKARFAGNLNTPSTAAPTGATAAAPASSTPSASTASSAQQGDSQAGGVTLQAITEKLLALHKLKGNPAIEPILKQFGATSVKLLPVTLRILAFCVRYRTKAQK
jgi:hypothetical protein